MGRNTKLALVALATLVVIGLAVWGLTSGGDDAADAGSANPVSKDIDYDAALADAPPPLADLYAQGDALIPGGVDELRNQLDSLKGYPAVVNAWASWCGPCRSEFPHFQEAAAKAGNDVAFLGVNTQDGDAAAQTFLGEFPLPYPSVTDPDGDVFDEYEIRGGLPATGFYNADGELVFVKQGPYTSTDQLLADVAKYAS